MNTLLKALIQSMIAHPERSLFMGNARQMIVTVSPRDHGRVIGRGGATVYALKAIAEAMNPPVELTVTEPEHDLENGPLPSILGPVEALERLIEEVPDLRDTKITLEPMGERERMVWDVQTAEDMRTVRAIEKVALAIAIMRGNKTFVDVTE
jgi:predicted RNA-binding protein YlqC (UPF0109 family)